MHNPDIPSYRVLIPYSLATYVEGEILTALTASSVSPGATI